jgi:SRSO17 transposase
MTNSVGMSELDELGARASAGWAEVHRRIGWRFARREMRERAQRYLAGLVDRVERKNGWQLSEALGESGPQGVQRLLNAADWDADTVRDDLRAYVVAHLGGDGGDASSGVLVVDETGFLKKGTKSAGVARQYSGTAGRRENQQIGVFLLYASAHGAAFIDRALYLPESWAAERSRRVEAHIPEAVPFATKGELAKQMLARALAAGVPARWVVGDTIYGGDELRGWLEGRRQAYVLAVPSTHSVWSRGRQRSAAELVDQLPPRAWCRLSAGEGSQGPRLYDWACLRLPYVDVAAGQAQWLLIRRSLPHPDEADEAEHAPECAYYRAYGPEQTPLAELVQVAGRRWTIEAAFEQAKGEVGLDHYEVRRYDAWYRHVTLALLAHAFLEVVRCETDGRGTQSNGVLLEKGATHEQSSSSP